jgi:acetyltransferase-like isoleucine patch superfamily enzyme
MASAMAIDPTAEVAEDSRIDVESLTIGPGAVVEAGATIEGGAVTLAAGSKIGARASIKVEQLRLGYRSSIGSDCTIGPIGAGPRPRITLGDNSMIGPFTNVLLPELLIGDYVAVHHHSLVSGYERCLIGHNTWIGQNCVLNCTGELTIGNNVGFGAYSSVYTHIYNGELLEGCQLWNVDPVVIEDNVWIVGCYNVISPGVTVGRRGVILTGSVVSKDVEPGHLVAGIPAKDLTDRLQPYRDLGSDEKLDLMRRFVREFVEEMYPGSHTAVPGGYRIDRRDGSDARLLVAGAAEDVIGDSTELTLAWVASAGSLDDIDEGIVIFDIASKQYTKRLSDLEIEVIRFMNGFRARFVPANQPRVV